MYRINGVSRETDNKETEIYLQSKIN